MGDFMDQTLFNWLLTGFGAALGWILKVVWDAVKAVQNDIKQIERDLPDVYVRKDDFRETVKGLRADMHEVKVDMKDGFRILHGAIDGLAKKLDRKTDKE